MTSVLKNIDHYISLVGHQLVDLCNSNFGVAATGSFFGAVGGYVMVIVTNKRTEIFSKVGATKVAIALCHSIFNTVLGLYTQQVKSLFEKYESERKVFLAVKTGKLIAAGTLPITYDYRFLLFPHIDFSLINSKLFEKTDLSGRSFILATVLVNNLVTLRDMVQARHDAISHINSISDQHKLSEHDKACLYFGIKFSHPKLGDIQEEKYLDIMRGIKSFNEDCIWFSKELTQELIDSAKGAANQLLFFRPKIGTVDYSDVDTKLLPNDENYKDWREKFKKAKK